MASTTRSAPPRTVMKSWTRATLVTSVRPAAAQHAGRGVPQDAQVPPEGPRRHVGVIQALQLVVGQVAATRHLPQAGDARAHVEAPGRPAVDLVRLGDAEGAGAAGRRRALWSADRDGS